MTLLITAVSSVNTINTILPKVDTVSEKMGRLLLGKYDLIGWGYLISSVASMLNSCLILFCGGDFFCPSRFQLPPIKLLTWCNFY